MRCAAALVILLAFATSCSRSRERPLFKLLTASETGVDFANTIVESDSLNVQTDVYIYNGAGVAVGDIDNDGLPDIFFSGNVVSSRLYRNEGGMRFHDITTAAGVSTSRWATGAAMADVNGDGLLDIYVSVSGPEKLKSEDRANLLFINNGHGTFTESASKYGVADTGFTTQAAFLDYNRDGCLDLFLLNNSPKDFTRGVTNLPMMGGDATPGSHNQLYRNDCPAGRPGRFTNVSAKAGIARDVGYGLGVAVSDLNGDGWPDIYVSNDGIPNDVVYINNRDGTFTNRAAEVLKHTSQAGMGVDIADFNNDGRPDILQVDMLPAALQRRKRTLGTTSPGALEDVRHRGFRDDYIQNSLQLNNGVLPDGNPVFSEISRLAGVSRTDWSWSALFADFDNDGNKDLFIGNGYPKAVNDLDYLATANGMQRRGNIAAVRKLLRQLPAYDVSNYFFVNNGDLTFSDQTKAWGLERPSFSYGAAYADLDNDGRLDLVVNNIDAPAFIYHNVQTVDDAHHFLRIKLEGDSGNRRGIGASVVLTAGGRKQYLYQSPYRGFMSTVDDRLHFGLGATRQIDSLEIVWPDGRYQALMHPAVDRELVLRYSAASEKRSFIPALAGAGSLEFQPVDARKGLTYQQAREIPLDYGVQPLLPYNLSSRGPMVAVGDVNGDGLDDVFIGGGAGSAREILIQKKDGSFAADSQPDPWVTDKDYEDWGALFFDANGDGRPDLYVASGGFQLTPGSPLLQDRLYINKGGRFVRDSAALPVMLTITGTVRAGDFNGDGRPDLFVGGRLTPRRYPLPTRSYILRNDGGHFTDVTATVAPELIKPGGLVTDAQWLDFDGDGRLDLVTTGEWMSVEFYRNEGGHFREVHRAPPAARMVVQPRGCRLRPRRTPGPRCRQSRSQLLLHDRQ